MNDLSKRPPLAHASGTPVTDNFNIETAGQRGPALLQDIWLIEKLAHFAREVIPERRMSFTVTHDITRYTKARIFSEIGKQTPMFARFSTVAGERGAADAERDIRGFALKFYTEGGNWDVVGNNTPVFFFHDPLRFPDLNHAIKCDPRTGMRSADNNWDFWTLLPESPHQVTIVMSDRGIPKSLRHMHGFGSHAYSFLNAANERQIPLPYPAGHRESDGRGSRGPRRQGSRKPPARSVRKYRGRQFPGLDPVRPGDDGCSGQGVPLQPVRSDQGLAKGGLSADPSHFELNRNPENVFAEVEQAAFSPANIVPGISYSPDKMLQGRLFSYGDAQRYRLGVNHHHIPINAPKCPFRSYHRDGAMRTDGNLGGTPTYFPNSRGEWIDQPQLNEPMLELEGGAAHWDHRVDDDHYPQTGNLFRKMTPAQQQILFDNTARQVGAAARRIQERHVVNCAKADPAYGAGVAKALGIEFRSYIIAAE